eukprot:1901065-Pyramimonas_sp.AAC.1
MPGATPRIPSASQLKTSAPATCKNMRNWRHPSRRLRHAGDPQCGTPLTHSVPLGPPEALNRPSRGL